MSTVKITWLKSHPLYGYFPGDNCELPEKHVKKLLKSKHVKLFEAKEPDEPTTDLPEDLPGRDALIDNGVILMSDVKAIPDFTEIKGIGKSTNEQILEYLKK